MASRAIWRRHSGWTGFAQVGLSTRASQPEWRIDRVLGKGDRVMLILTCPCCGVAADETDLTPGGQAHLVRPGPDCSDEELEAYMFLRDNPRGVHFEAWRHSFGCGKWFHVARCTVTQEVFGVYPAQTRKPPASILKKIVRRRPGWTA